MKFEVVYPLSRTSAFYTHTTFYGCGHWLHQTRTTTKMSTEVYTNSKLSESSVSKFDNTAILRNTNYGHMCLLARFTRISDQIL